MIGGMSRKRVATMPASIAIHAAVEHQQAERRYREQHAQRSGCGKMIISRTQMTRLCRKNSVWRQTSR